MFLTDVWNFVLSIANAKDIIQNIDIKDKRKENKQNFHESFKSI